MVMLRDVEGSFFYRGTDGLVTPPLVPLVLLGLGLALLRLRSPGMLLLLGWWAITILGNSVMVAPDHSPRYAVVLPALMLLAALALRYLWPLLSPRRGRWLLLALLASVLALYQGNYYFNDYLPSYRLQLFDNKAHPEDHDAVYRSLLFQPDTTLHFVSQYKPDHLYLGALIHFMRADLYLRIVTPEDLRPEYLVQIDRGQDHAFFIEQDADEAVATLARYFYLLPPQYSPYPEVPRDKQYVLYYAPYLGEYSDAKLLQLELDMAEYRPVFGP
jgi:hypothetical protein